MSNPEQKAPLIGADGKEMKTVLLPTVKYKDFVFACHQYDEAKESAKKVQGGYAPGEIVREYRSRCVELEDRIQILMAILCVTIKDGRKAGRAFLESIGAKVVDLNGKEIYRPKMAETGGKPAETGGKA